MWIKQEKATSTAPPIPLPMQMQMQLNGYNFPAKNITIVQVPE